MKMIASILLSILQKKKCFFGYDHLYQNQVKVESYKKHF